MSLPEAAFRSQLRAFSREDLSAFLVDLWAARGREAERCADHIRLRESASPSDTRVYPMTAGEEGYPGEEVDIVVTATDVSGRDLPGDVEVVDPETLYRMVRYALEGPVSERLLATHFDVTAPEAEPDAEIDADDAAARSARPSSGADPGTDSPPVSDKGATRLAGDRSGHAPGVPDARSIPTVRSQSVSVPDDGPFARPGAAGRAGAESGVGDEPDAEQTGGDSNRRSGRPTRRTVLVGGGALLASLGTLGAVHVTGRSKAAIDAPGVREDGVVDAATLAEAHADFVEDVSYTLRVRRVGHRPDRSLRSYLSMDLSLAIDRSYRTHVATAGPEAPKFLGEPPSSRVYWSDGTEYLARSPSTDDSFHRFEPSGSAGTWEYWARMVPFGGTYRSGPERYYRGLFEVIPTRLAERARRDRDPVYHVVAGGEPSGSRTSLDAAGASEVRDVRLDAEIDRHGVVRTLSLDFLADVDGDPVGVHRTVEYSSIENTDARRPDV